MTHIDDWLDSYEPKTDGERFAKKFLEHARRPAATMDHKWLATNPLFCTYQGKRYRCNGASRLGDVWLHDDFTKSYGYVHRVDVAECSEWSEGAQAKGGTDE